MWGFHLFHILVNTWYCLPFSNSHSNGCGGFLIPNDKYFWLCLLVFCVFFVEMSKCSSLFPTICVGLFGVLLSWKFLYSPDMSPLSDIWFANKYFSQCVAWLCYFLNGAIWSANISNLNGVQLTFFSVIFFFFCLFVFFRAAPSANGSSQARGPTGAVATSPCQSHSKAGSKLCLRPTYTTAHGNTRSLTHWARPGIEPVTSWFLVRFVSIAPRRELLFLLWFNHLTVYLRTLCLTKCHKDFILCVFPEVLSSSLLYVLYNPFEIKFVHSMR